MMNEASRPVLAMNQPKNPGSNLWKNKKEPNSIFSPMVSTLAESLGISSQRAKIVVGYAAIILQTASQQNQVPNRDVNQIGKVLENLLKSDFAYRTGMANRLAQATGLTVDEAAFGLERAMMMLNEHCLFN